MSDLEHVGLLLFYIVAVIAGLVVLLGCLELVVGPWCEKRDRAYLAKQQLDRKRSSPVVQMSEWRQ